jgi:outer membrane lipoprotein-sorting protein
MQLPAKDGIYLVMTRQIAALCCLSAALVSAQAPDPAALLDRAAAKMREATTFRMAGVTVIESLSKPDAAPDTIRFRLLAKDRPNMARLDLLGEHPASRVCGGPKSFTYFEETNEVFTEKYATLPTYCYLTFAEWARLPDALSGVKLGGTRRVAIQDEERECTVVSGQGPAQAPATGNLVAVGLPVLVVGARSTSGSLCIDPGTGDVLWYQVERTLSGNERVRETTTFSHFEYGAVVTPEDFEVEVPADAKESRNARGRIPWPQELPW